jgi:hypothetical protein
VYVRWRWVVSWFSAFRTLPFFNFLEKPEDRLRPAVCLKLVGRQVLKILGLKRAVVSVVCHLLSNLLTNIVLSHEYTDAL